MTDSGISGGHTCVLGNNGGRKCTAVINMAVHVRWVSMVTAHVWNQT